MTEQYNEAKNIGLGYRLSWPWKFFQGRIDLRQISENSIPNTFYCYESLNDLQNIEDEMTLTFLGDFMGTAAMDIVLGDNLLNRIQHSDYLVLNMESVLTKSDKFNLLKQHTNPEKFLNFSATVGKHKLLLGLANNHVEDFGNVGLDKMLSVLDENKIRYFGLNGCPFLKLDPQLSIIGKSYWNSPGQNRVNTKNIEIPDQFLEFIHWGDEFHHKLNHQQQDYVPQKNSLAVIGHHAHIPQKIEYRNKKVMAYGLGNFTASLDFKNINYGQILSIRLIKNKTWKLMSCQWKFIKISVYGKKVRIEEMVS